MMRKVALVIFMTLLSFLAYAQGRTAGVCNMYDFHEEEKLPVPEGYEPWVISHYGRHGARYLTSQNLYDSVYEVFEEAQNLENLTEYGKDVYRRLLSIKPQFEGNAGALTEKGRDQHRRLARRMRRRFPTVFRSEPVVTAVSSTTPRCRESMETFCSALKCDVLEMRADSSDLKYLNPFHSSGADLAPCDARNLSSKASWRPYYKAYCEELVDTAPFEEKLFVRGYCSSVMSARAFEVRLFNIIQNLPCLDFRTPSFDGLFSPEEAERLWEHDNAIFFLQEAAGFYGSDRQYLVTKDLLESMIMSADEDLALEKPSVRLRFGHDMTLIGLLTLMDIDGWNKKAEYFADIRNVFQNWRMPMASNLQMAVYRKQHAKVPVSGQLPEGNVKTDDMSATNADAPLMRLYFNEKALSLPLEEVGDRLYRWDDFKKHYLGVVASAFRLQKKPACNFLFPIAPEYDGHAMQAFTVSDDVVYVGYDSGLCRTYDFRTGKLLSSFPLGCNVKSNHCGNLNFYDGYLYVSGDLSAKACYVERVGDGASELVQTIRFSLSGDYGGSQAIVDGERGRIVYMRRLYPKINRPDNRFIISEFPLPSADAGDVIYTDADAIRSYELEKYFPIYQGASVCGGKLYQSFGGPEDWPSSEGTGFAVFDLNDGRLLKTVRVPFGAEPQSVMKYKGRVYMNFNGHGLFEIVNYAYGPLAVAAYVWPSCHNDSLAQRYLWEEGNGEWEVIRKGTRRFEGHYQPKEPLWGYEMDNDPVVVEKWIDTALEYGVNTFIYDWYWYKGGPYLESALNDGFLKAPNNRKMDFFIMWANHDVKYDYWNVHRYPDNEDVLFSADFTEDEFRKIVDRIVSQYFSRPNYYRIDGCPVLAIYSYNNLVRSFGSVAKAAEGLDYFRAKAVEAGHKGIYLMDIRGEGGRLTSSRLENTRMRIDSLGVDGIAFYNMGGFNVDYLKHGARAVQLRRDWDNAFDVDVFPCVSIAWDDTPRFPAKGKDDVTRFNATPGNFGIFLKEALEYVRKHPCQAPLVMINAWNEWVEGSYLLPDIRNGFGYLEAVRDALSQERKSIDVMSFNIRNGNARDGENGWNFRKAELASFLNYESPDLVGLQEAHEYQLADIMESCPGYGCVGAGREDGDKKGEQSAILWNRSRIKLLDWGFFWLSETPDVPSLGWDARYLRTAAWALMEDLQSGHRFYVVNTHLDNKGEEAREKGLDMISARISAINTGGLPVVLTGDFNMNPDNDIVRAFRDRMSDARETAAVTDRVKSFNAWGDKSKDAALDYIFYSGFKKCEMFRTMTGGFGGKEYLSDHYPVRATLVF